MGFVSRRSSEISGQIIDDDQVITVIVRSLDKTFDAAGEELAGLKRLTNVIEVELQHPGGREDHRQPSLVRSQRRGSDALHSTASTVRPSLIGTTMHN